MPHPLGQGALSDDPRLTSVVYIGPKSKTETERPRKTKIGIDVAHVTRDTDTTFKVKRSKVNLQGVGYFVAASRTACSRLHSSQRPPKEHLWGLMRNDFLQAGCLPVA